MNEGEDKYTNIAFIAVMLGDDAAVGMLRSVQTNSSAFVERDRLVAGR